MRQQLNLIAPPSYAGTLADRQERDEVAAALRAGRMLNASQLGFALRTRAGAIRPGARCTVKFEGRELLTMQGTELLRMVAREGEYGLVPGEHVRYGDRLGIVLTLTPSDVSETLYGREVQPQEAVFVEKGKAALFGGEIVPRDALVSDGSDLIERLERALRRCDGWESSGWESDRVCHAGLSAKLASANAGEMASYDVMAAEWDRKTSQSDFWNMLSRIARIVRPQEMADVDARYPASSALSQGKAWSVREYLKQHEDDHSFEQAMVQCYANMCELMPENGVQIINFAHTDPGAWMRFGLVLSEAGLSISKIHMVALDPAGALRGDALTEAAVIVCRKRIGALPEMSQQEFAGAVEAAVCARAAENARAGLRPAGRDLRQQGVVAAMQVAVNNAISGTDRAMEMEAKGKKAPYNAMAELGGKLMMEAGA